MQWIELEDGELINVNFIKSFILHDDSIFIINCDDREIIYECESIKEAEEIYERIKQQINQSSKIEVFLAPPYGDHKPTRCVSSNRESNRGDNQFSRGHL